MHAMVGNLRTVYRECIKHAEETIRDMDRRRGTIEQEITEGAIPNWYVIIPQSGSTAIAAAHLSRRRFGVYQPLLTRTSVVRGRKAERKVEVFPGYLFAFIWNVDQQRHRIVACPGVAGMLMCNERPAVMPDSFIDRLQAMECVVEGVGGEGSKKRHRKRYRKAYQKLAAEYGEMVEGKAERDAERAEAEFMPILSTRSYWAGIEELEAPERIGLLHKALGLPS